MNGWPKGRVLSRLSGVIAATKEEVTGRATPTRRFLVSRNHPPRRAELLRCLFAAFESVRETEVRNRALIGEEGRGEEGDVCVRKWKGVEKHEGDSQGFLGGLEIFCSL